MQSGRVCCGSSGSNCPGATTCCGSQCCNPGFSCSNGQCVRSSGVISGNRALDLHNSYRRRHQSTPALSWSTNLENDARGWANYLASNCRFDHAQGISSGENLAYGYNSWDEACKAWYDEIVDYDYRTGTQKRGSENKMIGHFTAMVWAATTQVGCATAQSRSGCSMRTVYVCRYSPPGNMIWNGGRSLYFTNVKPLASNGGFYRGRYPPALAAAPPCPPSYRCSGCGGGIGYGERSSGCGCYGAGHGWYGGYSGGGGLGDRGKYGYGAHGGYYGGYVAAPAPPRLPVPRTHGTYPGGMAPPGCAGGKQRPTDAEGSADGGRGSGATTFPITSAFARASDIAATTTCSAVPIASALATTSTPAAVTTALAAGTAGTAGTAATGAGAALSAMASHRGHLSATSLVPILAPSWAVLDALQEAGVRPGARVRLRCSFDPVARACLSVDSLEHLRDGGLGSGADGSQSGNLTGRPLIAVAVVSLQCGAGADWRPGGTLEDVRAQMKAASDMLAGCSRNAFSLQTAVFDLPLSCSSELDRRLFVGRCSEVDISQRLTEALESAYGSTALAAGSSSSSSNGTDGTARAAIAAAVAAAAARVFILPLGAGNVCIWRGMAVPSRQTVLLPSERGRGLRMPWVIVHELLHVLGGLEHAGAANLLATPDYDREDDPLSAMGCGALDRSSLCAPDGGVCPNAPQMRYLGWAGLLADWGALDLPPGKPKWVQIPAQDDPTAPQDQLLVRLRPEWLGDRYTHNLYISYRRPWGPDSGLADSQAQGVRGPRVAVHQMRQKYDMSSYDIRGSHYYTGYLRAMPDATSWVVAAARLVIRTGNGGSAAGAGSAAGGAGGAAAGNTNGTSGSGSGTTTPCACPSPYTVAPGDYLYAISLKCAGGLTADAIAAANGIADPSRILVGQRLLLPGCGSSGSASGGGDTGSGDAGSAGPSCFCSSPYSVMSRDTLYVIATKCGGGLTPESIAAANSIVNMDWIQIGQKLTLPGCGGSSGGVAPFDTLYNIAVKCGGGRLTYDVIASANGIADPSRIAIGQKLVLPGCGVPVAGSGSGRRLTAADDSGVSDEEASAGPRAMAVQICRYVSDPTAECPVTPRPPPSPR
ncbi:hypothetical protein HXX76_012650 [Chlamydomonas incerta]|uniref:LysM domain-containing protein n=1 Tax=Chlamydomonas incerta TaxID=51695 RepID=A0A835SUQ1_CHLIN|nr:hypothetical protein HXX76_012650 [Chlamydomonas incerta]|eukprot:KAG2427140.1 hypothetical protein HXX76_012650 [Chlamydomonas incerta]